MIFSKTKNCFSDFFLLTTKVSFNKNKLKYIFYLNKNTSNISKRFIVFNILTKKNLHIKLDFNKKYSKILLFLKFSNFKISKRNEIFSFEIKSS